MGAFAIKITSSPESISKICSDARAIRLNRLRSTARRSFFLEVIKPTRCWLQKFFLTNTKTSFECWRDSAFEKTSWNSTEPRNGSGERSIKLSAEYLAALGAAALQYQTAIFSCHASTETVGALTLDNAGLKCTFHKYFLVVRWCAKVGAKYTVSGESLQAIQAVFHIILVIHRPPGQRWPQIFEIYTSYPHNYPE